MEQFIAAIVTILIGLPAYYTDQEAPEEREARLRTIATAIATSCDEATCVSQGEDCVPVFSGTLNQCVAASITMGFWESRFAKHIHEGKCRSGYRSKTTGKWIKGECDEHVAFNVHGQMIGQVFTSRSMWQMKYDSLIADEWHGMNGTSQEATNLAAWAATKKLGRCWGGNARSAFVCYAGSRNKNWPGAKPRVIFYEARLRQLQ
jgi:hypothetical protein